jgi:hypothetical protein
VIPRNQKKLARVFFGRLFENDVFSSSVAASSSVLWLLAFLAVPGVMFSGSQIFAYARLRHCPSPCSTARCCSARRFTSAS